MQEAISVGTNVATVIAVLVGIGAVGVCAYAGWMYATALGDPQKVEKARNAFLGAFVGIFFAGCAFIGPRVFVNMVIKPVGGVSIETEVGLNCDGILQNELVFQRAASTGSRMEVVIHEIQSRHSECASDIWSPEVNDTEGFKTCGVKKDALEIGDWDVPKGLMSGDTARVTSGRDSGNNILVYWSDDPGSRPSDGAACWLFQSRLNRWHANYVAAADGNN